MVHRPSSAPRTSARSSWGAGRFATAGTPPSESTPLAFCDIFRRSVESSAAVSEPQTVAKIPVAAKERAGASLHLQTSSVPLALRLLICKPMNRSYRQSLTVAIALASHAFVWWLAFDLFPGLPARIPMHFDLSGNPTRFVESSGGEWFVLPAIASLITLMLVSLGPLAAWLARENPEFVNVPHKEHFLTRSKDERESIVAPIGRALPNLAILVNALFAWILFSTARVGRGEWSKLPPWPLFLFLLLVALTIIPAIVSTFRLARPAAESSVSGEDSAT